MSTAVLTDFARIRSRKPGAKRSICASIRSVTSTSDPDGTWQYAHSVCLPAGALVGSITPGCATRQYGLSACRPAATSASLRATSSKVPATCTVPACRQASACQGTGPVPEVFQRADVSVRQAITRDACELTRGNVEQDNPGFGKLAKILDRAACRDGAAEFLKLADQRGYDRGASALGDRPACRVREQGEQQREPGGQR